MTSRRGPSGKQGAEVSRNRVPTQEHGAPEKSGVSALLFAWLPFGGGPAGGLSGRTTGWWCVLQVFQHGKRVLRGRARLRRYLKGSARSLGVGIEPKAQLLQEG